VPQLTIALKAKASVVNAELDTTYVLASIVDMKLTERSEHCAMLSLQTLRSGFLAFSYLSLPLNGLVANPTRLPVRLIVVSLLQSPFEQLQV
jgi:hypothetical protein